MDSTKRYGAMLSSFLWQVKLAGGLNALIDGAILTKNSFFSKIRVWGSIFSFKNELAYLKLTRFIVA